MTQSTQSAKPKLQFTIPKREALRPQSNVPVKLNLGPKRDAQAPEIPTAKARNQLQGLPDEGLPADVRIPGRGVTAKREALKLDDVAKDSKPIIQLRGSGLVPEDFQFDESQLAALDSLASHTHGCLIGAAGTGKTTCTKAFVQHISHRVSSIDANYHQRKANESEKGIHEEYMTPSVLLCSFTGKAVRQIKKNFPKEWHPNIMTIHRALKYVPEMQERLDPETGQTKTSRIFVPTHCKGYPMPWEVIIIDEASMVSLDLWDKFYDAMLPNTRIYMVGDLNQLPPVQGRSIFGYALARWNIAELTHVHRQKGSQDEIVPNAHRILRGEHPQEGKNFKMRKLSQYPREAGKQVQKIVEILKGADQYNPLYDTVITAVNGAKWESPSAPLGQIPLNEPLARFFNAESPRIVIDAGRSRKIFAVGDKVMATKNDYDVNVTNGMMGIIKDIVLNNEYVGDKTLVGNLKAVQERLADQKETMDFDSDAFAVDLDEKNKNGDKKTESFMRGTASHTIVIDFTACEPEGSDDEGEHVIAFRTYGEVESLQLAYASTCHKMQGSECPTTIVLCHEVFGRMLSREWLYTACTRASGKLLLLYTDRGLTKAIHNQRITGKTVKEKAESFRQLLAQQESNSNSKYNLAKGTSLEVKLPEPQRIIEEDDSNDTRTG